MKRTLLLLEWNVRPAPAGRAGVTRTEPAAVGPAVVPEPAGHEVTGRLMGSPRARDFGLFLFLRISEHQICLS